jgi:hypothetical protein
MATTGQDLLNQLKQKVGEDYTGSVTTARANRIFEKVLVDEVERRYLNLNDQKSYDEISNLVITENTQTPVGNEVNLSGTASPVVPNYHHLLTVKVKFTDPVIYGFSPLEIVEATDAIPVVIKLNKRNNIRSGEQLSISAATGNTNINGVRYPKRLNNFHFELYEDAGLTQPVGFNANYVDGGSISRVFYNTARPYRSDVKGSEFVIPTVREPYFETVENLLKLYPSDATAQEITIDYVRTVTVEINAADNVIDLELTYPRKFLYHIADVSAIRWAEEVKDMEEYETGTIEANLNP